MATKILDIKIDKRYPRQTASFAIADVYDALLEIITNCDDSYHRLSKNSGRHKDGGDIAITVDRHVKKPSRIIVSDKAEGMTRAAMQSKLGRIGKRTSEKGDRGFMARGIKECVALGRVTVQSIVDDKYCSCVLTRDFTIELDDETPANSSMRKRLGIHKNGTVVTLECLPSVPVPHAQTLARDLSLHYALRDILAKSSDARVRIRNGLGGNLKEIISSPTLYSGEPVYDGNFTIEENPETECTLTIWKHEKELNDKSSRLRESGILVKGERAIYQCSLLGYENDAKHYSGRLICPYIDRLLEKHDAGEEKIMPIDPTRKHGLNNDHPFNKKLTEKIESVLCDLLEQDKAQKEQKTGSIANKEMRKRLDSLARFANRLWTDAFEQEPEDVSDTVWRAIDMAEKDGIFILPPKFKVKVGEPRSLTVYVHDSSYNKGRKVRVYSSNPEILQVVKQFDDNEKLRRHPAHKNIFYGNIRVAGRAIGKSVVTVRPSKDVSMDVSGEVVKGGATGEIYIFPKGISLEFERKKYEVVEGKEKALKIFVKNTRKYHKPTAVGSVNSSKHDHVVILGGHKFTPEPTPLHYSVAEVRVEGRSLTERNQPAIVTAKLGERTAKTTVRVVEKKRSPERFDFELTADPLGHYRARWADIEGKPNLLKISATHLSIQRYFGVEPDFPEQTSREARALIAELAAENLCMKILQEEMKRRPGDFKFANEQPDQALQQMVDQLQKKIHKFSVRAHRIMQDG